MGFVTSLVGAEQMIRPLWRLRVARVAVRVLLGYLLMMVLSMTVCVGVGIAMEPGDVIGTAPNGADIVEGDNGAPLTMAAPATFAVTPLIGAPATTAPAVPAAPSQPLSFLPPGLLAPKVDDTTNQTAPAAATVATSAPVSPPQRPGDALGSIAATATTAPTTAASIPPNTLTTGSDGCLQMPSSFLSITPVPKCDSAGGQAITTVVKVVSFVDDPLAWLTDKMGQGASGIMSWIADTANNATSADLTNTWWIDAYRKAFGVAVILFGILTLWNMFELGRGKMGPADFAESLTIRSWGFFTGVIFGPPLARFLIEGAGLLSSAIIAAMPGFSTGKLDASNVNQSIQGASEGKIVGGAFMAFLLLLIVCIAAVMLFVSLAVQTFAVYASGAVFPLAFTWIINIRHRGGSMKIPFIILGAIFARPALFFLTGLVMGMARAAIVQDNDDASRNLATIIMVAVGLAIAALSPLMLLKFAPVIPTGMSGSTGHGASVSNPGVAQPGASSRLRSMAKNRGKPSAGAGSGPGRSTSGAGTGPAAGSMIPNPAAATGASPSGTPAKKKRGIGKSRGTAPGGNPSAAAAGLLGTGAPRLIDGAAAPKKPGKVRGAAGAVKAGAGRTVKAAKSLTPKNIHRAAQAAPGAIKRGVVKGAKATPEAAKQGARLAGKGTVQGAKLAGKGARKAMPVAGAVAGGASATAGRVGRGLANGAGGDDKWS